MDHLYNSSWMRPRHQDRLIFEEPDGDLIDCQLIASSASSSQLNREVPFERQRLPFNGDESNAMMRAFNANKKLKTGVEIGSYMPTAAQSSNGVLAMTSPPNIRIDLTSNTWDPFPFEARPTDKERQERIAAILEFLKLAASNPLLRTDDGVSGGGVGHAQSPNTSVLHSGTRFHETTRLDGHEGSLLHSTAHRKRSIDEALSVASNDTMRREGEDDNGETATRFRACQEERWEESFQELVIFKEEFGHCRVPHNYERNLALARWVSKLWWSYSSSTRTSMNRFLTSYPFETFTGQTTTQSVPTSVRGVELDIDWIPLESTSRSWLCLAQPYSCVGRPLLWAQKLLFHPWSLQRPKHILDQSSIEYMGQSPKKAIQIDGC